MRFGTLITPKIIRVVYILTIIVLALIAIGVIIGAFNNSVGWGIAVLVVFAPLGFLLYLIVARIWLELVIVAFKINESAQQIATSTATMVGPPTPPPPAVSPGEPGMPPATGLAADGPRRSRRTSAPSVLEPVAAVPAPPHCPDGSPTLEQGRIGGLWSASRQCRKQSPPRAPRGRWRPDSRRPDLPPHDAFVPYAPACKSGAVGSPPVPADRSDP